MIAENGDLLLTRNTNNHGIDRHYWHEDEFLKNQQKLNEIQRRLQLKQPWLEVSGDQSFRLTSIAFKLPEVHEQTQQLVEELEKNGCGYTINNLWVLGWLGQYDKLFMSRRILKNFYALEEADEQATVYYSGDSLNDAPMFKFYKKSWE